jgi:hypothetical protein
MMLFHPYAFYQRPKAALDFVSIAKSDFLYYGEIGGLRQIRH